MTGRCVITGIGVFNPAGCDPASYWATIARGWDVFHQKAIFGHGFRAPRMASIPDLHLRHALPRRMTKRIDRFTTMGIMAGLQALASAGLEITDSNRDAIGIMIGNCTGGWSFVEPLLYGLYGAGDFDAINAYVATAWFPTAPQGELSILLGIGGFSKTLAAENLSVGLALEQAAMLLEEGQLDAVLVGGTEAPLTPLVYNACLESGMLSPTQHYRPFHHDADGMLLAEGAAMIVMEEESRARARGARIFADVMGVGFGASLAHSMRDCLSQADTSAGAVDYLILDARGSWADDAQEYAAIESVFGRDSTVRMSAPKSVYGNLIAASMGTDLATACLALERQAVPPTVGDFATLRIPPTGHHVVGACESATLSSVLVNGRDNYGHGMSILLGAPRQVAERGEGS